ncbi:MAG: DUF1848 domain-containing protein [Pseudomonadota bacterium]
MHLISASRRTDIPAFHADWFMNRIRTGSVRVVAPFGGRVHDVSLKREDVTAVVFWTKNAAPLLPHLQELTDMGHCFSFLYTVNNYPDYLEPRVPKTCQNLETIETICRRYSTTVFRWRYDTIVLTERLDRAWHINNFTQLCKVMSGFTDHCITSFCDYYRKTIRNMNRYAPDFRVPTPEECGSLAEEMAAIGRDHGISLLVCAHDFLLGPGTAKARCIDPGYLTKVVDTEDRRTALAKSDRAPSRKGCACVSSRDIGAYDTCGHGCAYCYANADPEKGQRNIAHLTPNLPSLSPTPAKWPSDGS